LRKKSYIFFQTTWPIGVQDSGLGCWYKYTPSMKTPTSLITNSLWLDHNINDIFFFFSNQTLFPKHLNLFKNVLKTFECYLGKRINKTSSIFFRVSILFSRTNSYIMWLEHDICHSIFASASQLALKKNIYPMCKQIFTKNIF
jgi:hypothetical protein